MSDPVLVALIGNTAAVIISIIVSLGNRKKLNEVHKSTNGLVTEVKKEAFSQGVEHQKEEQKKL